MNIQIKYKVKHIVQFRQDPGYRALPRAASPAERARSVTRILPPAGSIRRLRHLRQHPPRAPTGQKSPPPRRRHLTAPASPPPPYRQFISRSPRIIYRDLYRMPNPISTTFAASWPAPPPGRPPPAPARRDLSRAWPRISESPNGTPTYKYKYKN